jgi:hypothetical protein
MSDTNAVFQALLTAAESAQCACSLKERESGHLIDCWRPELSEAIAHAKVELACARVGGLREAAQRLRALFPTETKTVNAFEVTKVFIDRTNGEALMDALTALDVALAGAPSEVGCQDAARYRWVREHWDEVTGFTWKASGAAGLDHFVDEHRKAARPRIVEKCAHGYVAADLCPTCDATSVSHMVDQLLADDEMHPEWHNGVAALAKALGIPSPERSPQCTGDDGPCPDPALCDNVGHCHNGAEATRRRKYVAEGQKPGTASNGPRP